MTLEIPRFRGFAKSLPAVLLPLVLAALLSSPGARAAEESKKVEGHSVTLDYAAGSVDLNHSVNGMVFLTVKIDPDDCEADDKECDVKFIFEVMNKMDDDGVARAAITLLDEKGNIVQTGMDDKDVEEDEDAKLTVKLEVPGRLASSVKKCRVDLDSETD